MKLGKAAVVFAFFMLVLGIVTAIRVAQQGHKGIPGVEFAEPEGFLLLNCNSIIVFIILVVLGWKYRNQPAYHKRFMLMANVGALMPPGISRLPFISGSTPAIAAVALLFIFLPPLYDLFSRRKIHIAYIPGILLPLLSIPPVVAALSSTDAWHSIAAWMMKL